MYDVTMATNTCKAVKIDASSNNIPTGFSTAAGSLVMTGVARATRLCVQNYQADRLAINYTAGDASNAPTVVQEYVPPGTSSIPGVIVLDNCQVSSTVYIKSDSGSVISSGVVTVSVG